MFRFNYNSLLAKYPFEAMERWLSANQNNKD